MNKLITINYLSHTRPEYAELTFHYLNLISRENKDKIHLNILASSDNDWLNKCTILNGITYEIHIVSGNLNYLNKLNIALNSGSEYSVKLDEDCFINNFIWDYIIESVTTLNNKNNLLISPIMTNNIPSCDLFIEKAIKDELVRGVIHKYFLEQSMPNGLWGVNYDPLNKHTINTTKWDYKSFYKSVGEMKTQTKGIHPVRISGKAQITINDYIGENIDIIDSKNKYNLIEFDAPYFTNSLFAIKTEIWREIINNGVDSYDEISLNNHKRKNNKKILFIDNGFGVHLMFNTIYGNKNKWGIGLEDGEEKEKIFYNKIRNLII